MRETRALFSFNFSYTYRRVTSRACACREPIGAMRSFRIASNVLTQLR